MKMGHGCLATSFDDNVNAQDYIYSISKLNDNQISISGALCAGTGSLCTVDFDTFEYTVQSSQGQVHFLQLWIVLMVISIKSVQK